MGSLHRIRLGVVGWGDGVFDSQLVGDVAEDPGCEVGTLVAVNGFGDTEPGKNYIN